MGKKVKVYLNEGFQVTKETKIKHEKIPPEKKEEKKTTPVWLIVVYIYFVLLVLFSLKTSILIPDPVPDPQPDPLPVIPKRPPVPCPPAQQPFC